MIFPDPSGCVFQGREWVSPPEHWDHGFESPKWHGCVSEFLLFMFPYVGSGLAMG
jgi:hypothetical protein